MLTVLQLEVVIKERFVSPQSMIEPCCLDLTVPPGPPRNLTTSRLGPDHVTLEWKPPAEDGGAKVTGYRVEKCEETSEEWVKVEDVKSYDTVYKVTGLKDGVGYYFSVSAKNQAGYGEPCETETPVKPKKPEGRYFHSSGKRRSVAL